MTATALRQWWRRPDSRQQHRAQIGFVGGLAEDAAAGRDRGVAGEHDLARGARSTARALAIGDAQRHRRAGRSALRGVSSMSGAATRAGTTPSRASRSSRRGRAGGEDERHRLAAGSGRYDGPGPPRPGMKR